MGGHTYVSTWAKPPAIDETSVFTAKTAAELWVNLMWDLCKQPLLHPALHHFTATVLYVILIIFCTSVYSIYILKIS